MVTVRGYDFGWLVWFCAAGNSFFPGVGLILIAVLLLSSAKRHLRNVAAHSLVLLGTLLIALSATPLAWWFYSLWLMSLFVVAVATPLKSRVARKIGLVYRPVVLLFCLWGVHMNLPYHLYPELPEGTFGKVYVVGDSVSAGIGGRRERTWPKIIGDTHGVDVVDLSEPGATVGSAIRQGRKVRAAHAIVFLEIGGNDLFVPTPRAQFEKNLRELIEKVSGDERLVVMLELPLLPWHVCYGRVQRRLAEEARVLLVPKRFLASIFSAEGATVDLAHLSPEGHKLMAEKVWDLLGSCLTEDLSAGGPVATTPR